MSQFHVGDEIIKLSDESYRALGMESDLELMSSQIMGELSISPEDVVKSAVSVDD
jgi:hypothetical protein